MNPYLAGLVRLGPQVASRAASRVDWDEAVRPLEEHTAPDVEPPTLDPMAAPAPIQAPTARAIVAPVPPSEHVAPREARPERATAPSSEPPSVQAAQTLPPFAGARAPAQTTVPRVESNTGAASTPPLPDAPLPLAAAVTALRDWLAEPLAPRSIDEPSPTPHKRLRTAEPTVARPASDPIRRAPPSLAPERIESPASDSPDVHTTNQLSIGTVRVVVEPPRRATKPPAPPRPQPTRSSPPSLRRHYLKPW